MTQSQKLIETIERSNEGLLTAFEKQTQVFAEYVTYLKTTDNSPTMPGRSFNPGNINQYPPPPSPYGYSMYPHYGTPYSNQPQRRVRSPSPPSPGTRERAAEILSRSTAWGVNDE